VLHALSQYGKPPSGSAGGKLEATLAARPGFGPRKVSISRILSSGCVRVGRKGYGPGVEEISGTARSSAADAGEAISRRTSAQWADGGSTVPAVVAVVEVLIPSCERPAELAVTLAGLAGQDGPPFNVVVSDQSAKDPDWQHPAVAAMVRVLRVQGRKVTLGQHLPRRGMAEHRQHLLDLARAPQVLFLDNDVWLEPGALARMSAALVSLGCGFVGMAVQGLSYLHDDRPGERVTFEPWSGPVTPERIRRDQPGFARWPLHNAANPTHLGAGLGLKDDQWLAYRVAWLGGCVLFDRSILQSCGGFDFWSRLPRGHSGEDVTAQWRVMERFGGAGLLPSGAVHLESPTTVRERDVDAFDIVFSDPGAPAAAGPDATG
jgi:GT2 family glycosyltransferase